MNNHDLLPSDLDKPYLTALSEGRLAFQRCTLCKHPWMPASWECPSCLASSWKYEYASGNAVLVSWIVYHKAYHPSFDSRVPYNVAVVELREGPRLITNIVGNRVLEKLTIGASVRLTVAMADDGPLAQFSLSELESPTCADSGA